MTYFHWSQDRTLSPSVRATLLLKERHTSRSTTFQHSAGSSLALHDKGTANGKTWHVCAHAFQAAIRGWTNGSSSTVVNARRELKCCKYKAGAPSRKLSRLARV